MFTINFNRHPFFKNSFKTVFVRNIALTAPYMHNGSFSTLEKVLGFYYLGGGAGLGLEVIAFMETLTDTSGFMVNK